jgi:hypothetical protein
MSLNSQGKIQNVKASLEKYIYNKLVILEGFSVDFEGFPFEGTSSEEWIEERILGKGVGDFHRQVSSSAIGQTVPILLNFNVFVDPNKTKRTNRHYEIRDIIANYFKIGTQIDLYDASNGNWATSLQKMEVEEIATDRPIPDPNFHMYNFTVEISWLEQW